MTPPHISTEAISKATVSAVSVGAMVAGVDTHDWIVVIAGLVVGLLARWAIVLSLNEPLGWKELRIDGLIIAMNGLLAMQFGQTLSLHGIKLAVIAAMFGASSTLIFAKLHAEFLARAGKTPVQVFAAPDTTTHVPPATRAVDVTSVGPKTPQTTGEVAIAELSKRKPVEDHSFDTLLARLKEGE
jgi:hypothetical protein